QVVSGVSPPANLTPPDTEPSVKLTPCPVCFYRHLTPASPGRLMIKLPEPACPGASARSGDLPCLAFARAWIAGPRRGGASRAWLHWPGNPEVAEVCPPSARWGLRLARACRGDRCAHYSGTQKPGQVRGALGCVAGAGKDRQERSFPGRQVLLPQE